MNEVESPDQNLNLLCWIHKYEHLLEAFIHMCQIPKSCVLTHILFFQSNVAENSDLRPFLCRDDLVAKMR